MATTQAPTARADLDLLGLPGHELEALYRAATVRTIPTGLGRGTAIFVPGRGLGRALAKVAALTAWQGKVFSDDGTQLVNMVSPLRMKAVKADVYEGDSWLDNARCIVIDYSKTSWSARWVHDEIREVAPGRFLGLVYLRKRRLPLYFALDFTSR